MNTTTGRFNATIVRVYRGKRAEGGEQIGTAFMVSEDHLLTALHVVDGLTPKQVFIDGLPGQGDVGIALIHPHGQEDAALLALHLPIANVEIPPLAPPDSDCPTEGTEVVIAGYNNSLEIEHKTTHISGQNHSNRPVLMLHTYPGKGMSGGPILYDGMVAGICDARDIERNRGYLVPLRLIRDLLEKTGIKSPPPTGRTAAEPASRQAPITRAAHLFVGREHELKQMEGALLPDDASELPVYITSLKGMPGTGKSYLADRFFEQHRHELGGYQRIALDPQQSQDATFLLAELLDTYGIKGQSHQQAVTELAQLLRQQRILLHIENVDSDSAAGTARQLVDVLTGCRICISGRLDALSFGGRAKEIRLISFDEDEALEQLHEELQALESKIPDEQDGRALVRALGGLPLAIHIAAGHMAALGFSGDEFLTLLRGKGLRLQPYDSTEADRETERLREVLDMTFDLSLQLLEKQLDNDALYKGFQALGHLPSAGAGKGLAATVSGLSEVDFLTVAAQAKRLSLLERDAERWRIHPLLAEHLRNASDDETASQRLHEWFVQHLQDLDDQEQRRINWERVAQEEPALTEWLSGLSPEAVPPLERLAKEYATTRGPYRLWLELLRQGLDHNPNPDQRSNMLWTASILAHSTGELDEALRIRQEEELPVYERLGDVRGLLVGRAKLALAQLQRNKAGDREQARALLCQALEAAVGMRIPEASQIIGILLHHEMECPLFPPEQWEEWRKQLQEEV